MKTIEIELEGTSPLLQHRFGEEELFGLLGAKQKKAKVIEELTPRDIATKAAYKDDAGYYIPMEYIVGAFKYVASDYKETNKSRKSLKTVAGGAFRPTSDRAHLLDADNAVLQDFEVDVRKATNHQKGAVAVCRPRFDKWKTRFKINIDDSIIAIQTAQSILEDAGKRSGIGSFRVSKGGYFGQFRITEFKEV